MKKTVSLLFLILTAASLRAQSLSEKPLVTFGVVADAQYDRDTTVGVHGRRYHLAIERLSEAISVFNDRENIAFTVSLGDIIDRNHLCFPDLQPVLAKSKVKIHYVYGNHDYTHSYDP
ncbi:MAG: metallophosphoesterase, partial [Bacteroidales bacterium]|nr:metallophosphoesterase [Bacteroidales bacterium]